MPVTSSSTNGPDLVRAKLIALAEETAALGAICERFQSLQRTKALTNRNQPQLGVLAHSPVQGPDRFTLVRPRTDR